MSSATLPEWLLSLCIIATLTLLWLGSRRVSARSRRLLPPGPVPLPLFGNVLDVPRRHIGQEYDALARKYGDIIYMNVLGKPLLVLGSHKAAHDILEKRSALTADRPPSMMVKLGGWDWLFLTMSNGPELRRHRRAFHQSFSADIIPNYHPVQRQVIHTLLRNLLNTPDEFVNHVRFMMAQVVLRVVYGIELKETDTRYFDQIEKVAVSGAGILLPGRYLVELFPILRFVPAWLPGAGFKRVAAALKRDSKLVKDALFEGALHAVDQGSARHSIVSSWLDETSELDGPAASEEREFFKSFAGTTYLGGADTSNMTIQVFFLAMACFPEAQRKAQAELDAVVGPDRLPDAADGESLIYMRALLKEVLRWHTVTPLGVAHCASEDFEYNGYLIPKGTSIMWNAWAFSQDTVDYPNPEVFDPDRFLKNGKINPGVRDPATYAFGYGRRMCPGHYFAEAEMLLLFASVLHAFTISSPLDNAGLPLPFEPKFVTHRLLSEPEYFRCRITPRSTLAAALVRASSDY